MISVQLYGVELALRRAQSAADAAVDVDCRRTALEASVGLGSDLDLAERLSEVVPCLGRVAVPVARLLSRHVVVSLY